MNQYSEQLDIAAAQLRPGDTVLLKDSDRIVKAVKFLPACINQDGHARVLILWTDETQPQWIAHGTVEVIR